jgi:hypothetical protein
MTYCRLQVDGRIQTPISRAGDECVFRVNFPAQDIRLLSGFARPADFGDSDDPRSLGVALLGLRWEQDGLVADVPIDNHGFIDGFYHLEDTADESPLRWTNGNAGLPSLIFPPWTGAVILRLRIKTWRGSELPRTPVTAGDALRHFEGLGTDCELALAQRHYGIEPPLSLFRWAGTTFGKVLRGLQRRFEGLGDPATTTVLWESYDYRLRTPYANVHTTTIAPTDAAGRAEILQGGCAMLRLLRLLRRKLLRDIAEARHIFVFWTDQTTFGETQMRALFAALRDIGPAALLCVTLGEPAGQVRQVTDGLYAGTLSRFVIPDGPFDEWLALCTETLRLHNR